MSNNGERTEMRKRISIDISELEPFEKFLKTEGIQIDLITSGISAVEVLKCEGRKESGLDTIYATGWVACETARALAQKLDISIMQMGKIMNYLNVKIRHCSLGCFQ